MTLGTRDQGGAGQLGSRWNWAAGVRVRLGSWDQGGAGIRGQGGAGQQGSRWGWLPGVRVGLGS